jgi:hypothetical protein
MKGLIFAHRHLPWCHARGQLRALLLGYRHRRRLQGGRERLLAAIGGRHHARQAAQLQELTHHPHPRPGAQGDDELRGEHQPLQLAHTGGCFQHGRTARRQGGARRRCGAAPALQRTAYHTQRRGGLLLRLSRRQAGLHLGHRRCPFQARRGPHGRARRAIGSGPPGSAVATALESSMAGPSNIFHYSRLGSPSKGMNARRSCQLLPRLFRHTAARFGGDYDRGPREKGAAILYPSATLFRPLPRRVGFGLAGVSAAWMAADKPSIEASPLWSPPSRREPDWARAPDSSPVARRHGPLVSS